MDLQTLLYKKPRLIGSLCLMAGIIAAIHLMSAYREGGSLRSDEITGTPILLLYGLGTLIDPRILLAWKPGNEQPPPALYKAISIVLIVIAGSIGLYLSFVVFKDWKPAYLK